MANQTEWACSIESANIPNHYIRHRNYEGFLDKVEEWGEDLPQKDATFVIGPGLADARLFSIRSSFLRNHFLRHQGFRLKLQEYRPGDEQFAQDATFELTPALAYADVYPGGASFRSSNFRDHFIRHRNYELWLVQFKQFDETYRKDTSFHVVKQLYRKLT